MEVSWVAFPRIWTFSVPVEHWSVGLEDRGMRLVSILEPPAGSGVLRSDAAGRPD